LLNIYIALLHTRVTQQWLLRDFDDEPLQKLLDMDLTLEDE
jgi:hypothetical protein